MKFAVVLLAPVAFAINAPSSRVSAPAARSVSYGQYESFGAQSSGAVLAPSAKGSSVARGGGAPVDVGLLSYFFFWYLGNYYYNIANKMALKASGGASGFPMTIATLQLAVGSIYALFAWAAPDMRKAPRVTVSDVQKMLPVAFCSMMAHCASVFAMSAGAVSFGQIVKAAEPAFAAVLSQFVYGNKISTAKWLCLLPVIGGVVIASVTELDFAVSALVAAASANLFAAFKGNENKKLMDTAGLSDRIGGVGNQFALTTLLSTVMAVPLLLLTEGSKWGSFVQVCKTNPAVLKNLILSGLYFYGYNELATMTIKKTSAITQSVANTAKRVIIIIGVAMVLGESLSAAKLAGSAVCIGGVFLYSIIDDLLKKM